MNMPRYVPRLLYPPSCSSNFQSCPRAAISFLSRGRRARNNRFLHRRNRISTASWKFNHLLVAGKRVLEDLQSLIRVDRDARVLFSYRQSTLQFISGIVLGLFIVVASYGILYRMVLGLKERLGIGQSFLIRRDRSLGGREVVVGRKRITPLCQDTHIQVGSSETRSMKQVTRDDTLPKWWVFPRPAPVLVANKDDYQRRANVLLQASMARKMKGVDIAEDDIIELRRICRTSGARLEFETENTRDSFYRASVDIILNKCCAATKSSSLEIERESVPQFLVGLAEDVKIGQLRSARMISAAVAARTRSYFLQAWALEVQSKRTEALLELSKICRMLQVFPPNKFSPEMELVGLGLGRHLRHEQREFLMDMFTRICGDHSQCAAEALGLVDGTV